MADHHPGDPPAGTGPEAWEAIYQADDAGWDLGQPSPPLLAFSGEGILPPPGTRVAVPGCGSGHEVAALAAAGYQAAGIDFAPSAIAAARQRLVDAGLDGGLHQADCLAPIPDLDGSCDWLFEQTFFCALRPEQRGAYAAAMARLLKPGGELWALHLRTANTDRQPFDSTVEVFQACCHQAGFATVALRPLEIESHQRRRGRETLVRLRLERAA